MYEGQPHAAETIVMMSLEAAMRCMTSTASVPKGEVKFPFASL